MKYDPRLDFELEDALAEHELEDILAMNSLLGDEVEGADLLIPAPTLAERLSIGQRGECESLTSYYWKYSASLRLEVHHENFAR